MKDGKTFDGTPDGSKSLQGDDALFLSNVEKDPGESTNQRHDNPAVLDELLTLAENWMGDVKRP